MRYLAPLLFLLIGLTAGEPSIPDTPAGSVLRAWLTAFNSGDHGQISDYVNKYEPERKSHIDELMAFRERTGGFTLLRIEKREPLRLEALMKDREGGNFARLTLELNDSPSPTVKQLGLRIVPRPADQPEQPKLTYDGAVKSLDAEASRLTGEDRFSGAILVARGGKIAIEKAYGMEDREKQQPNSVDTQFRIGSMNKMFTATAVLQLAGAGKIDLSAPLAKYLPDYPNHDLATKVTIRNLLTHTGGTGDIFTPEYDNQRLATRELKDYVKLFGSRALEFEPGSKWSYSNYGFILLGIIVEKTSGVSYYEYVRKNIFDKAGMKSTDSLPEIERIPKRSAGYMRKAGAWVNNSDTLPWRASSAGGGYSTVGDLLRFAQALSHGELIKPELVSQMTSPEAGVGQLPPGQTYGFGMMVSDGPHGKRFGHGGGAPGMNGELRVYPKSGTVIVVLANLDPPSASRLADFFDERKPAE